ncbi:MAG: type IV pilin protein [Planctomycetota bacterium]|jgi:general secretion pathway protein G
MPEPRNSGRAQSGFTLLEMMIVVTVIATIATVAIPNYLSSLRTARIVKAKATIRELQQEVEMYRSTYGALPPTLAAIGRSRLLDPWGNPYVFLPYHMITYAGAPAPDPEPAPPPLFPDPEDPPPVVPNAEAAPLGSPPVAPPDYTAQMRRDRNMLPLNSDFDLFSLGPDHLSEPAITAAVSLDDVIRADDGSFIGVAREY